VSEKNPFLHFSGCGNLFAVDYGNSRIQEFDSNGTYLSQWGSLESGIYQFRPYGVAVDSNQNVYVADIGNDLVKEYGP
jgi:tripartite motif-containing protein 71